jgi:hypothetical protein
LAFSHRFLSIDGTPNSYAYVHNISGISGAGSTIMRVGSGGLFKIARADAFAPAADTVGNEIYFSSAQGRVQVNLYDGTALAQNNATRCAAQVSRYRLPGIHAAPVNSGNIALVTTGASQGQGVNIRHWNSTSFMPSNEAELLADGGFVPHAAGPPTSLSLFKKLSDSQFLLQSSPLHLGGLQSASVFATMLTGGNLSHGYISNGVACNYTLFRIQHITPLRGGVSAVFTTQNETESTILDLWWLSYGVDATNLVVKRLSAALGPPDWLFLRETDLTDSTRIPVAFQPTDDGNFYIAARVGSANLSAVNAYTFSDNGDYVSDAIASYVGPNEPLYATPVLRDSVLAISSGVKNITFYSSGIKPSRVPCATCAAVGVQSLAVIYDTSAGPAILALDPATGNLLVTNSTSAGRRYTTHSAAVPSRPLFVVITTDGSNWYSELWNADSSTIFLVGQRTLSVASEAQPFFCGPFANGTVIVVPRSEDVEYTYWSFENFDADYSIDIFPSDTPAWCNAAVAEQRAVINTATRVILFDASAPDPAPKREFIVPEGTTLNSQMDIYRPIGETLPRLISTAAETNRDFTRFEQVVTMPWDFCLNDSDCSLPQMCINSACLSAPSASSPPPSSPPIFVPTPKANAVPSASIPSSPPSSTPSSACVGLPPFAGATCVGSTWVIQGSVNVTANGTVVISSNTVINGTFVVSGSNISVVIAPGATLEVTGCAQFDGNLVVNVPTTLVTSPLTVITFNGYCGGLPTRFTTTSLRLTPNETCEKLIQEPSYTDRSVAILFSFDRSECSSASVGLSTGAIVGIVIGIVALFAIIAIILVLRFKGVIRPFADHEKSKPTPVEEDPDL